MHLHENTTEYPKCEAHVHSRVDVHATMHDSVHLRGVTRVLISHALTVILTCTPR